MNTSVLRSAFTALVFAMASAAASAVTCSATVTTDCWTPTTVSDTGNFTVTYDNGQTDTLNIQPDANSVPVHLINPMLFYRPNLVPQDSASIQAAMETQFGLPAGSLTSAGACDNVTTGCSGGGSATGGPTGTYTVNSTTPFDYLAIHVGGGELFFHWSGTITQAILSSIDVRGVSNFRAYSAIPLPGAMVLFLSAIGFFGMLRRRFSLARSAPTPAIA